MLSELQITNFAIIDHLELTLAPKFNVITGETGAGKSIIIDAVNMLLGSRTDADLIRAGTDRAIIEGVFKLTPTLQREVRPLLDTEGIEQETPDEVTLAREIRSNGRTVCRINGTSVGMGFFREVGGKLVDIHGQSEHLSLLRPREHVNLLDRYANLMDLRASNGALVRKLNDVRGEIDHLMQDEAALARRVDMLGFQIEEIRATDPRLGEEEELKDERTRLANSEQLATLSSEVRALLVDGQAEGGGSTVDLLAQAALLLGKLAKIDPTLTEAHDLIESMQIQADDLGRTIRSYSENIEFNPTRLNDVEERLEVLARLKRKYGGTLEAVLEFSEKAQRELDSITHSEERLIELRTEEDKLLHQIGDIAFRLSNKRQKAAQVLGSGIEAELQELRMGGARFEVQLAQVDDPNGCYVEGRRLAFDMTGIDQVEFMMSANPGEPLRAMAKVASGGEAARIMLALKSVLSRADQTPTLIFDEIDQGIGGRVGATVGRKLWGLSADHQVLCVTHLAQLAGYGDIHFKVAKSVKGDRTTTMIRPLTDPERVIEIADMLGSESDSARQSALDIINIARNVKVGKPARADMPDTPAKDAPTAPNGNGAHGSDQADDGRPAPVQKSLL